MKKLPKKEEEDAYVCLQKFIPKSKEELEKMCRIGKIIFDGKGGFLDMLAGPEELKEAGLETYAKQRKEALSEWRAINKRACRLTAQGRLAESILEDQHALKLALGPKAWKRFYASLMGETGILEYLHQIGEITEEDINEIDRKTGWLFNQFPVPIYEKLFKQESKQYKANEGGLYKLILEVKPRKYKTFFAKKHGKKAEFDRTVKTQPYLAAISNNVGSIICADPDNNITIEPFIQGDTLTDVVEWHLEADEEQKAFQRLKAAINNLTRISQDVEKDKKKWEKKLSLEEYRLSHLETLGKGGKSFTDYFKEKFVRVIKPRLKNNAIDGLVGVIEKYMTKEMDETDTCFCHGDAHTDNVIISEIKSKFGGLITTRWVDWEYAKFSIPQIDLAKLLKKTGISKENEKGLVDVAYQEIGSLYKKGRKHFKRVYEKTKIYDLLLSAAKYYTLSFKSKKNRAEKRAQADIYYTEALWGIHRSQLFNQDEKDELMEAVKKLAGDNTPKSLGAKTEKERNKILSRSKLRDLSSYLTEEGYSAHKEEIGDPLESLSIENLGCPSIMEKYSKPPLRERIRHHWRKSRNTVYTGLAAIMLTFLGTGIFEFVQGRNERAENKQRDISIYCRENDVCLAPGSAMLYVEATDKYAGKYENVHAYELLALINTSQKSALLKERTNRIMIEQDMQKTRNNIFTAAKRLSDMKEKFRDKEDIYLAFFAGAEFVEEWKEKALSEHDISDNYWNYSRHMGFPAYLQRMVALTIDYEERLWKRSKDLKRN